MSKIIVTPNSKQTINDTLSLVDGYILGIKDLSVNLPLSFTLEEIQEITKTNKEIFISLNKNIHNDDIELLTKTLLELEKLPIKAIMFYDASIVSLKEKLNLKHDLVWAQEHLGTNVETINYWYDLGVKYAVISSEITKEEIKEIKKTSKALLLVNMFGYLPMFTSKRNLVKNYLNYFNLKDNSKINYIENEGNIYPLVDNILGTTTYSNNVLNGIEEYIELKKIDYIILNSFLIENNLFKEVVSLFKKANKTNASKNYNKITNMFKNIDKGFLNKETIYRVKK